MCWDDIRIARRTRTNVYTTTGELVIPANANRIAIAIAALDTDIATLFCKPPGTIGGGITSNVPMIMTANDFIGKVVSQPVVARLMDYGDILKGPLILSSSIEVGVVAYEVVLDVETSLPSTEPNREFIPR